MVDLLYKLQAQTTSMFTHHFPWQGFSIENSPGENIQHDFYWYLCICWKECVFSTYYSL